jgi:hypothetical protein
MCSGGIRSAGSSFLSLAKELNLKAQVEGSELSMLVVNQRHVRD